MGCVAACLCTVKTYGLDLFVLLNCKTESILRQFEALMLNRKYFVYLCINTIRCSGYFV